MTFQNAIRTALKETNTTQQKLAEEMNYSHGQANIAKILSRKDIYLSTLVRLFDKLGYQIIVQKKGLPHTGEVITNE